MKRLKLLLILFIMAKAAGFAQTATEAEAFFNAGNYKQAFAAYQSLAVKKPSDPLYNYRLGYSAYMLHDNVSAANYFKKSALKYPLSYYYLGQIYFDTYAFDEAVSAYQNYLKKSLPADSLKSKAELKLKQSETGSNFMKRIEDVVITDSMIVDKDRFLQYFHLPDELGTIEQSVKTTGDKKQDEIRYTTERNDRTIFSESDSGQMNLYSAYKLLNGWSEKMPLTDLNTPADENYPFLMLDGVTLYYASNGENSLGGYDLFITRYNPTENKYLKPENIGMPFNSPYNDYMMMIDENNKVGWFLSDRFQPEGKVVLYRFIPNDEKKIIQSSNRDSLIIKAQINYPLHSLKRAINAAKPETTATVNNASTSEKIFINDRTFYSDPSEFKSSTAKNFYFQWMKAKETLKSAERELQDLRKSYYLSKDEQEKKRLAERILPLEARVKELYPQVEKLAKNMRNEEIRILQ